MADVTKIIKSISFSAVMRRPSNISVPSAMQSTAALSATNQRHISNALRSSTRHAFRMSLRVRQQRPKVSKT